MSNSLHRIDLSAPATPVAGALDVNPGATRPRGSLATRIWGDRSVIGRDEGHNERAENTPQLGCSRRLKPADERLNPRGNHFLGEALHFFQLRTALEEQKIDPGLGELGRSLGDLIRRSDKSGAQSPVGD